MGVRYYTPHYENHLQHLRDDTFTLLEIGIGSYGRSSGRRIVADVEAVLPRRDDRRARHRGQVVRRGGADPRRARGPDGRGRLARRHQHVRRTHRDRGRRKPRAADIVATFGLLPLLPGGAIFVIEDTQTSYWPEWGGQEDPGASGTSMAFVKTLLDGSSYEEFVVNDYVPTYERPARRGGALLPQSRRDPEGAEQRRHEQAPGALRPVPHRLRWRGDDSRRAHRPLPRPDGQDAHPLRVRGPQRPP